MSCFDYAIPPHLSLSPGDIVTIPFRGTSILGIVKAMVTSTSAPSGTVKEIVNRVDQLSPLLPFHLDLIAWASREYIVSPSLIGRSLIPRLPARATMVPADRSPSIVQETQITKPLVVKYIHDSSRLDYIRARCAEQKMMGKQTLIITPLHADIQVIREVVDPDGDNSVVLRPDMPLVAYYNAWQKIRSGMVNIIIGTRSAIFAPCTRLGSIIIDREESEYHKQEEPSPRYNAKGIADFLRRATGCSLILLSQAPSLLALHAIREKRFEYIDIDTSLTSSVVHIIDLRDEYRGKNFSPLSLRLTEAMTEQLSIRRKIFLFLNRKGEAGALVCSDCGTISTCPACMLPLSVHGLSELICHHCDYHTHIPTSCSNCRGTALRTRGFGTGAVEAEVRRIFPHAKVLKLDLDTPADTVSAHPLTEAADIIIGTVFALPLIPWQTIGLVGVITADTAFHLPDFRAAERTYALLYRIAGLASAHDATLMVQTAMPDHHAIYALTSHSLRDFYVEELHERLALRYPPFSRLIKLLFADPDQRTCAQEMARVYAELSTRAERLHIIITPPMEPHIVRVRGLYRMQMVIKAPIDDTLPTDLIEYLRTLPEAWIIDVDPESVV